MERIKIDPERFKKPAHTGPRAGGSFEDLINQIVEQCHVTEQQARTLRRRLAVTAKTAKWSETDLHALLKKRTDPKVRNYTALVHWFAKVERSRPQNVGP